MRAKINDDNSYPVGLIWSDDDELIIKQDANGNFISPKKDIELWIYYINNPWSITAVNYEILPNYENINEWIARKFVIVYDSIDACIAARGTTPGEALSNLEEFILEVTEQYYKEDKND
jgi:predicted RNase H-like HicB family nuclease